MTVFPPQLLDVDRPVTPVLVEIAQVLVPSDGDEGRLLRALELLGRVVPYEQCALAEVVPGGEPRVRLLPEPSPPEVSFLAPALLHLLDLVSESGAWRGALEAVAGPTSRAAWGSYLAVPLVGPDGVGGLLLVSQRVVDAYDENDLRLLSIVAAQVAAYLTACRLRSPEMHVAEAGLAHPEALRESDERLRVVPMQAHASRLTTRQLEVARLIAAGRSNAQIARELVLTKGTVANHIEHILRRLDVSNRAQVAAWVVERGLQSYQEQP